MKKYSSKNGYYKYYNSEGISLRIKIKHKLSIFNTGVKIMLKFKDIDDEQWQYTVPSVEFHSVYEIVKYLCKHTTNKNTVFKVLT